MIRRLVTAAALGLALALAACAAAPSDPATAPPPGTDRAVVGLTYIPNIQFAPFYIAEQDKLLPTGVTLRHHGSGEGLFTALGTGEEDFVVAGGDEILQARAQGIDVVAVAAYYRRYPARIIVPADSPIHSVADLKGKTIGLPGRYGENWFALVIAMQQAGLTEADVNIQEIGYTQQVALPTGKVDATVGFSNGDAVTFRANGFAIREIDPAVPLVSICLATTRAYAEAHPEVVRELIDALDQAILTVKQTPEAAITAAAAYIPDFNATAQTTAREVLAATTELFFDDFVATSSQSGRRAALDPPAWVTMGTAMTAAGLLEGPVDVSAALTTAYL